jgi:carboxyl-terminal processing protease
MKYVLSICLLFSFSVKAQNADSVRVLIDSALNIMQYKSVFGSKLDWQSIRANTYELASDAKTYQDAIPALRYAFDQLKDKHGWLVINDSTYGLRGYKADTGRLSQNIKAAALKGPRVYTEAVSADIAYISVPFFGGQTTAGMNAFAQKIQDSLCKNINSRTKGIIIDLRLNAGGNMYPMFVGVSNVLGDGVVAKTMDSKKNTTSVTELKNGSMTLLDTMLIRLKSTCGDLSRLPVAILTGPVTGSAGECLAVGFKGRQNTVLIGEETAGFTSANEGFYLPGTGNAIVTAMDFVHDRNGNEYRESVQPDIKVVGDDFFNRNNDPKIRAALKWFSSLKKKVQRL